MPLTKGSFFLCLLTIDNANQIYLKKKFERIKRLCRKIS